MPARTTRFARPGVLLSAGLLLGLAAYAAHDGADPGQARWRQHDIHRPKPPVVEPAEGPIAAKPPKDAVVLFDGSNLDAWKSPEGGPARWKVAGRRPWRPCPGTGPIETKAKFGDIQLHVEWAAPEPARRRGPGPRQQRHLPDGPVRDPGARLLQGRHLRRRPGRGDLRPVSAPVQRLAPARRSGRPTTSPSAAPGSTPSGKLLEPARITLFHNGILVQNNEEPFGPTSWLKWLPYDRPGRPRPDPAPGPRPPRALPQHLAPRAPRTARPRRPKDLDRPKIVTLPADALDPYAGTLLRRHRAERLAVHPRAGG